MKFSIPVALFYLASGAHSLVAAPPPTLIERFPPTLVERDLATATSVLADVRNGFDALSAAAKEFNGNPEPMKAAAAVVLSKVATGTTALNKMTPLSFFDCLSLIAPAQELQKQGTALANQLKAKKDTIQQFKQCGTTFGFLNEGVTGSQGLITGVVAKVPSTFKGTVQTEGDKVTQQLKDIRDVFSPANCSDA